MKFKLKMIADGHGPAEGRAGRRGIHTPLQEEERRRSGGDPEGRTSAIRAGGSDHGQANRVLGAVAVSVSEECKKTSSRDISIKKHSSRHGQPQQIAQGCHDGHGFLER